jgi:aryl-alcohol dehydrogenase-like predicted oxidoreductase
MQTRAFAEFDLSMLTLGTVQFGLPYGIANTTGQPPYETARDIIACAVEGGVNVLDTAASYGESEAVIGRALAELGLADQVIVVSKVAPMADFTTAQAVDAFLEEQVAGMLKRLRLTYLPICMFHVEENACYLDALMKLKERGLIRHVGVSMMTPEKTAELVGDGKAEALQIPTNMLDQRFIHRGLLQQAGKAGTAVFIRSVYLQGLIPQPESDILPELAEVIPVRRQLEALAHEAGISITELAMRYVLAQEGVTSVLVGVETLEQMRENLTLFNQGPLPADLVEAINAVVPDLPEEIIVPRNWSKRMPDTERVKR